MKTIKEALIHSRNIKKFSKKDLKEGYIVRSRNGDLYEVHVGVDSDIDFTSNCFRRATKHNIFFSPKLREYTNNLRSYRSKEYDIIGVYGYKDKYKEDILDFFFNYDPNSKYNFFGQEVLYNLISSKQYKLIWEDENY